MIFRFFKFSFLLFILFSSPAYAQNDVITLNDIGVTGKYVCVGVVRDQTSAFNYIGIYTDDSKTSYEEAASNKLTRKLRRNLKKIRRQIKKAKARNKKRVKRLKAKRRNIKLDLVDIGLCLSKQGIYMPEGNFPTPGGGSGGGSGDANPDDPGSNPGEDNNPGDDGNPGGNPGGGEGSNPGGGGEIEATACEIVTGTNLSSFSRSKQSRIIRGENCSVGNSAIVELSLQNSSGTTFLCSGTVINDRSIVTAAHCLEDIVNVIIITGGGIFNAASFTAHPNFELSSATNDVGVVISSADLPTNQISLVASSTSFTNGETAVISGYGIDENENLGALKAGFENISSSSTNFILTTFSDNGDSTICNGDSGGPLLVKRNNQWVLAGVNSFGPEGCVVGGPYAYMNLTNSSNRNFILNNIN